VLLVVFAWPFWFFSVVADEFLDRSSSEASFNHDPFFQAALLLRASENAMNDPIAYGKSRRFTQ
jgi:hypothetical protein